MDRPTTPAPNIIELALQYGASSYRNRSDTAHPAYGFTERGLLQFAESLVARAHPRIAALHTIAQYPARLLAWLLGFRPVRSLLVEPAPSKVQESGT